MIIYFKNRRTGIEYKAVECGLFIYEIRQGDIVIEKMHWWVMDKLFEDGTWVRMSD